MDAKSGGLDYWRKYFRGATSDIFEVIEHAITVASSDCPEEFKMRRDRIAEMLFCCRMARCFGCNRVELQVPAEEEGDGDCKNGGDFVGRSGKESKVNSSSNGNNQMNTIRVSNYSYDETEALTEEIEEESQIVKEVLRIKDVLSNSQDESEGVIFESLRRLQLMALSVETLKATEIGRAVNNVRKHGSKKIRHLARTLIDGWKVMVDEWVRYANAIAEGSPDSVKPSIDEEGLPSPPLDEGAFFATQTTGIELSQFFDGMDDDGNPRNSEELDKNCENGRKTSLDHNIIPKRKQQPLHEANMLARENKDQQVCKPEPVIKQTKPLPPNSGPGRHPKLGSEHKANNVTKSQQKPDLVGIQRRLPAGQQDKPKCSDELSVRVKLEATKRKLQEGYQQAENGLSNPYLLLHWILCYDSHVF
uniref:TFIIS N-terminal domain-containing protein n=1 Tax=Nelumbo nucifera TaxID=4432 RepID=A0A822Y5J1_NELNU|nr:TPA_asm: hypothetical protein HUJ06_030692 [Nelumbo nucifera]